MRTNVFLGFPNFPFSFSKHGKLLIAPFRVAGPEGFELDLVHLQLFAGWGHRPLHNRSRMAFSNFLMLALPLDRHILRFGNQYIALVYSVPRFWLGVVGAREARQQNGWFEWASSDTPSESEYHYGRLFSKIDFLRRIVDPSVCGYVWRLGLI